MDDGGLSIRPRRSASMAIETNETETPVLALIGTMTAESIKASSRDAQTRMLVRPPPRVHVGAPALVAVDAPPVSHPLNLGASRDVGIDAEQVRGVLAAVAPIVGTARIAAATGNIVRGIGIGIEVAELRTEPGE